MVSGKQKKEDVEAVTKEARNVAIEVFGKPEKGEDGKYYYTVGSGKGQVPLNFLSTYRVSKIGEYRVGDKVPIEEVAKAIDWYKKARNPKNLRKAIEKEIEEMRKPPSDKKGIGAEAGAQFGVPIRVETAGKDEKVKGSAGISVQMEEKYGKTWFGELRYGGFDEYEIRGGYGDLFVSLTGMERKVGMAGPPVEVGLTWMRKWVRPYFGLNYGPWYFLYNPLTKGFYGGFNIFGGIINYAQAAFSKGMNECEGCGSGKKVLAGLGELIGLSSGIREGRNAWKRSKGNFFQRFFYSVGHFFKGMVGSIEYVGLQVGIIQPLRLFANSLYRFVFRAKTPKDAKTRKFTPEEISKMQQKLQRELAEGMIDKAKDDVEMWLKYEKLPPAFKGYLMGIKDKIDMMSAYVGLPFTLFPPGWKKSKAKKEIEKRTRNAIEEIKQDKNIEQNTAYLSSKLGGVTKKTMLKREIFEEFSPCVVPQDEVAEAVAIGIDKLASTEFKSWTKEIEEGKYDNAYRLALMNGIIFSNLAFLPLQSPYSYLHSEAKNKIGMEGEAKAKIRVKAGYYSAKQEVGERIDNENELLHIIGAYLQYAQYLAYLQNEGALSKKEREEWEKENKYISKLINQDQKMATHLFSRIMNRVEEEAQEWRKAMEKKDWERATEHASVIWQYSLVASTIRDALPEELATKMIEENKSKICYFAIVGAEDVSWDALWTFHPEFKKVFGEIKPTYQQWIEASWKNSIKEIEKAIEKGDREEAKRIWEGISKVMQDFNKEKANTMSNLLEKKRWEDEDKEAMKTILRYFDTKIGI